MSNAPNETRTTSGAQRRAFLKGISAAAGVAILPGAAASTASGSSQDPARPAGWEIVSLDARQLAAAIQGRSVSCVEVMQAYLEHIDRLNPRFNALVSRPDSEALLAEAARCDDELNRGKVRGWMHGFPHAPKDLADARGLVTSNGSPIFKHNVATEDAVHIARIRDAGAIMIGKTNVPEFGMGSQTYNPVFGPTYNAWDGVSTAGGSSGGAAAALALKLVPVADGSDFMGSLRNPAGYNNVIGFRPTPGLVPLTDSFIEQLPCNGPMGRTVSDTALLLSVMAGYTPEKPTSLVSDPARFTAPLSRDFSGTRVGWLGDFNGYLAMESGVLELCEQALGAFRDIGCTVESASVDFSMAELWQTWLVFRHWLSRGKLLPLYNDPALRAQLKPEAVWEAEGGSTLSGDQVYHASQRRAAWYQALLKAFEKYDFLVLPSAQVFPFNANIHWPKTIAGRTMDTYHRWMEVVVPGTLSGCPVINVPAGFGRGGLPMGLQVIAPRHQDFSALQIAYAYEQAAQWNLRHSPPALTG
jgi:amidase